MRIVWREVGYPRLPSHGRCCDCSWAGPALSLSLSLYLSVHLRLPANLHIDDDDDDNAKTLLAVQSETRGSEISACAWHKKKTRLI